MAPDRTREVVIGLEVHAQLLENLVSGVHLTRWTDAKWVEPAIILVTGFQRLLSPRELDNLPVGTSACDIKLLAEQSDGSMVPLTHGTCALPAP